MTQSPSPSVDEVAGYAAYWHGQCQAIATLLGLPEPEEGFAGVVRDHVASLVSPPKAGAGEPVASLSRERLGQLIYEAVYSSQGGKWSAVEPREVWYGKADWLLAQIAAPNHEARGDGVRVTDEQVDAGLRAWLDWPAGSNVTGHSQLPRMRAALEAALSTSLTETAKATAGHEIAWACVKCNSPRSVNPCQKCGTPLTKPADGWDWPTLPDIDHIRKLAREVGYAIGVHGSLERDLDLIAAPWVESAIGPYGLALHIAAGLGGEVVDFKDQDKPCGRWSCNIHTPDWTKMIDLSVMPPAIARTDAATDDDPDAAYELGKRDGYEEAIQELDVATGGDGDASRPYPGGSNE